MILVTETFFKEVKQNLYYVRFPGTGEQGYYRAATSFNAFFNSMRNPRANVTEVRQFTADSTEFEIGLRKAWLKDVDWDNLKTFGSMWEFYDFIGYDHRARKYKSGETLKVWDGRHFVLPTKK